MKKIVSKRDLIWKIFLGILLFVFMIYTGSQKQGFYVDEYFSFLLANTDDSELMEMKHGNTYTGAELMDIFYVQDAADRFDFGTVWELQGRDNHPPFYYAIVHFVSSLTLKQVDLIVVGLAINIIIAMITFVFMIKLAEVFVENKMLAALYATISCASFYFINCMTFIRMYMLLMLFTVILVYLLCKQIGREEYKASFFVQLYLTTFLGTFSQYFFLIMLVFCCFFVMIQLIYKKKWKELGFGVASVIAGLATVCVVFHEFVAHIFKSQRGTEAFSNAQSGDFVRRIKEMYAIVDVEIFGKQTILVFVLIIAASILYLYLGRQKRESKQEVDYKYIILILPAVLSFVIISKIVPECTDRYIMLMMPFLSLGAFFLLRGLLSRCGRQKITEAIVLALMIFCVIQSYEKGALQYLYENTEAYKAGIEQYGTDTKCLFLYDKDNAWRTQCNLYELRDMTDITFYAQEDLLYNETDFSQYDHLVIFVNWAISYDEKEMIAQKVAEIGKYTSCDGIGATGYADAFMLSR